MLSMAEVNHPQIKKQTVFPTAIVDLVKDDTKLNGYGVQESDKKIENIHEYGLRRDEKLILDFGDHRVGTFKIDIDQTGSPMDAPLYLRLKFAEMPAELAAESSEYIELYAHIHAVGIIRRRPGHTARGVLCVENG